MQGLYQRNIDENLRKQEIYCSLMLGLYKKKDNLSEIEIKFMDLLKRLLERGILITISNVNQLINQRFTKEQLQEKEFLDLFENFKKKLLT